MIKTTPTNAGERSPATIFKNSLREWRARWKAQQASEATPAQECAPEEDVPGEVVPSVDE
jgi:hypothetical protein